MTFLVPYNSKIIKSQIFRFVVLSWPLHLPILPKLGQHIPIFFASLEIKFEVSCDLVLLKSSIYDFIIRNGKILIFWSKTTVSLLNVMKLYIILYQLALIFLY